MTDRTKALWLAGLVALILSLTSYRLFGGILRWTGSQSLGYLDLHFVFLYLLALPFIGAIGAYWLSRAGGTLRYRVLAALLPALWELASVVVVKVNGVKVGFSISWSSVISAAVSRALIPGAALILGALPFLGTGRTRHTAQDL
jgi:hypothetical protein